MRLRSFSVLFEEELKKRGIKVHFVQIRPSAQTFKAVYSTGSDDEKRIYTVADKMMFSGLKKTGIAQNSNNGIRKRDRHHQEVSHIVVHTFVAFNFILMLVYLFVFFFNIFHNKLCFRIVAKMFKVIRYQDIQQIQCKVPVQRIRYGKIIIT